MRCAQVILLAGADATFCAAAWPVIHLHDKLVKLLPQFCWRQNVDLPELIPVGPCKRGPDLFVCSPIAFSHKANSVCPLVDIWLSVAGIHLLDQAEHPDGRNPVRIVEA